MDKSQLIEEPYNKPNIYKDTSPVIITWNTILIAAIDNNLGNQLHVWYGSKEISTA